MAEVFLAVEVAFRGELAISLEVREVFPEIVEVSLGAVFLAAAIFLAAEAVCPGAPAVCLRAVVAFRLAAIVFLAEAVAVPLDTTLLQTILRCSPISADRDRVAAECHRVQPELNPVTVVSQSEEPLHNYPREIDLRKFPLAMKPVHAHAQIILHPNVRLEAMRAIFWAWPVGLGRALRSAPQLQINPVSSPQIVLAAVKNLPLHSNAQIGTRVR